MSRPFWVHAWGRPPIGQFLYLRVGHLECMLEVILSLVHVFIRESTILSAYLRSASDWSTFIPVSRPSWVHAWGQPLIGPFLSSSYSSQIPNFLFSFSPFFNFSMFDLIIFLYNFKKISANIVRHLPCCNPSKFRIFTFTFTFSCQMQGNTFNQVFKLFFLSVRFWTKQMLNLSILYKIRLC